MSKKIDLIRVTQEDIDLTKKKGTQDDCSNCAIAKALRRAGYSCIDTDYTRLYIDGNRYRWPEKVGRWQEKFVEGEKVKPFSFRISKLKTD